MADADALGPHDLVITSSTLGNPPFAQLVAAAAGAGIRGLSLWPEPDFARTLASGTTAADMRALLADHGLVATLEFSAGTHAPDLNTARRIVETAGRPNGAILVDAWHLHLGRSTLADLAALPGELAAAVQVNDGPAERPADFAYATRYARLAPGDGTFDLPAFVAKLDAIGCRAPLGIEVFNAPLLDELGPAGLARRLAGSVRALRRRP